jgi:hypothetical protein
MRIIVLAAGLLCAAVALATTYKWVDRNGVVHYSDRPEPGAEVIQTPSAQTFRSQTPQTPAQPANSTAPAQPEAPAYTSLDLWKPQNDETVANSGNVVTVRLRLEPDLRPGHSIWLYLDGKRVDGLPDNGENFTLQNVFRGTHTLSAIVADSQGKPLVRSQSVTFHLRQPSTLAPKPVT